MSELLEKETGNIIGMCKSVLEVEKGPIQNNDKITESIKKRKSKEMTQYAAISKFSPSEESENNKIIEKFRSKYNKKKEVKEILIRKTDLGENEMIFTKEELEKLKEIDDDEMFGISILNKNQNLTLKDNNSQKQQENNKYFFNPSFDKPKEEIQKYLDWVNLNEVKGSKDKNKNKIINFQKRLNASTPNLLACNKIQKFPLLNTPKNISSFAQSKNPKNENDIKKANLMKKNSVDKGFLNSINSNDGLSKKKLTKEEKMFEIVEKVTDKMEKTLSSSASEKMFIYMTEERKQALFECEVLRRIKREMGPKYFNNLHITNGTNTKSHRNETEEDKENNEVENYMRKTIQGEGFKSYSKGSSHNGRERGLMSQDDETESERMIQKNINRLNEERKRVIEKISC